MAKEWVQISNSQAKVFEASYIRNPTKRALFIGLAAFVIAVALTTTVVNELSESFQSFLIRFIEYKFLNGELLSATTKKLLSVIFLIVSFIIQCITFFILIWLFDKSKDEFVFDLNKKTISHIDQSNFDRLLRREGSVEIHSLVNCSKVAVVIVTDEDSDGDNFYFYSLEVIGDYLGKKIQIDRSGSYSSPNQLVRLNDITYFQNLARKIGDFLQLPVELEPSEYLKIKHEKGIQEKPPEKQNLTEIETIESAVEKIYKILMSSFGQTHEYRLVNSEDFQGYVDLAPPPAIGSCCSGLHLGGGY
ncbi:MAG: hypothetical protein Q6K90_03620 [Gloeomargarita sp. HHBFW_bins_162]